MINLVKSLQHSHIKIIEEIVSVERGLRAAEPGICYECVMMLSGVAYKGLFTPVLSGNIPPQYTHQWTHRLQTK